MSNKITVNGVTIESAGRSVVITNGRVVIDGKDVTPDTKNIRIEIAGSVQSIDADVCGEISVSGNVAAVKTQSGDVRCGDVQGSVKTMSGDVICGRVSGDVETMSGNITTTREEKNG